MKSSHQKKGVQHLSKSSDSSCAYNKSLEYLEGRNVELNEEKAFELNFEAAQDGMNDAILAMGWFYLNGVGVEKNIEKATKWYKKSARQGVPSALYSLGEIEYDQQNYKTAVEWFERASKKGHVKSLYWLGKIYYKGCGVKKDRDKAFRLFNQAAQKKFKLAQRALKWLHRHKQIG